jgi:hypothetical protein
LGELKLELFWEQGIRQEELGHHEKTVSDLSLSFKIQSFIISYELFMTY